MKRCGRHSTRAQTTVAVKGGPPPPPPPPPPTVPNPEETKTETRQTLRPTKVRVARRNRYLPRAHRVRHNVHPLPTIDETETTRSPSNTDNNRIARIDTIPSTKALLFFF